MFPLFLDLTDRLVVIIGGGPVGQRKAGAALDAGAHVRLVCLEPRPTGLDHHHLDWLGEPYSPEHLDGATLVFAAATPEVNRRVVADARQRGVWVNTATEPECGDFILPSIMRRGDFVFAVSTGGAAPALARNVCERLAEQFDQAFSDWVALLREVRPVVMEHVADTGRRRELFERLAGWEWLERLRREGRDAVRSAMWTEIQEPRTK
jgi:precorrin-2 dehydrogenase/sirohydrochlorin ferrochelatase